MTTAKQRTILSPLEFEITIKRLCHQLIENHDHFINTVFLGLQPRGIHLAKRLSEELKKIHHVDIQVGALDVTFYRDDFRRKAILEPKPIDIEFIIENKNVVLIDDVLFTGRTIRAGLDAMLAFGRPNKVELLVLINRRYSRHVPIQADYIGKNVHSIETERVKVEWKEFEGKDKVVLYTPKINE